MDAVGALGVGCAVAVASVLASNLTLVPAVMLSCPDFLLGTLAHCFSILPIEDVYQSQL
jgi:uncharacterized membrane protein YdfJ with MMPL/SSD domain